MWNTEYNTAENTMTQTLNDSVIVVMDISTNERKTFKLGVLIDTLNDPEYCQDQHLEYLLILSARLEHIQASA